MKKLVFIFLLCMMFSAVRSAEWQWSVPIKSLVNDETKDHPRAFLWIPENCKQVRGVVIGQHNMLEEGILEHASFRRTLTELGFAEIWVTPMFNMNFDFNNKAGEQLEEMMKALALESGYSELEFAPIVPLGHSAAATYPWNCAAWNPARTLALLSIHGDSPQTKLTGYGRANIEWGNRNIDGVPSLMVMGEYEWWENRILSIPPFCEKFPNAAVSFLADAGHGHFDFSDELVEYLALFVRKAAQYRLPKKMPLDKPADLIPVYPQKGWLADRWHKDSLPNAKSAPFAEYKGKRSESFWYFDKKMCDATEKFYVQARGKQMQYIGYVQNGKIKDSNLAFLPKEDGVSFDLSAVLLDSVTDKTGTRAVSHAKGEVNISRICGAMVKTSPTSFRIQFYRMGLNNSKRTADCWFMASHKGDDQYKSAVLQASFKIPYPNKEGIDQKITFPSISNQKQGTKSIDLKATSDSKMQVYYYVREGAAEIEGNTLVFTKIPPRAKFPMKVTVVAWQYGRTIEPKVKTAEAVTQTFYIEK